MEINALKCNNCGANLDVPKHIKFITCGHCGGSLHIKRSGNAYYTELLEGLHEKTDHLLEHSEMNRIENEIERLDRTWEAERKNYEVVGKDGQNYIPTKGNVALSTTMSIGFGIFWVILTLNDFSSNDGLIGVFFPLLGLIIIGGGIYHAVVAGNKAEQHAHAKRKYKSKREKLLQKLKSFN